MGEAAGTNIEEDAKNACKALIFNEDRQDDPLDMEPLKILKDISLNKDIREVDGSLQIAKVYKSNRTEFFGIYWESSKGRPCFQGREYNEINKPLVRYYNPDTFEIIESDLPRKLNSITQETYQDNIDFVQGCFDEEGFLKNTLSEKNKHELRLIFKDVAYRQFLQIQEHIQEQQINSEEL